MQHIRCSAVGCQQANYTVSPAREHAYADGPVAVVLEDGWSKIYDTDTGTVAIFCGRHGHQAAKPIPSVMEYIKLAINENDLTDVNGRPLKTTSPLAPLTRH